MLSVQNIFSSIFIKANFPFRSFFRYVQYGIIENDFDTIRKYICFKTMPEKRELYGPN